MTNDDSKNGQLMAHGRGRREVLLDLLQFIGTEEEFQDVWIEANGLIMSKISKKKMKSTATQTSEQAPS
jgi:hypothetical protein